MAGSKLCSQAKLSALLIPGGGQSHSAVFVMCSMFASRMYMGLALNAVLMIEEQTQKCRWCKKLKVSHFRILNMSLDSKSDYAGQFRGVFKKKKKDRCS